MTTHLVRRHVEMTSRMRGKAWQPKWLDWKFLFWRFFQAVSTWNLWVLYQILFEVTHTIYIYSNNKIHKQLSHTHSLLLFLDWCGWMDDPVIVCFYIHVMIDGIWMWNSFHIHWLRSKVYRSKIGEGMSEQWVSVREISYVYEWERERERRELNQTNKISMWHPNFVCLKKWDSPNVAITSISTYMHFQHGHTPHTHTSTYSLFLSS